MKRRKLLIIAILMFTPFVAQADLITHTFDFTGLSGGNGTDGAFTYEGLNGTNSGNCPAAPGVGRPCAQLNANNELLIFLTDGGVFDLIEFYWRSTGQQQNSDQGLSWVFLDNTGDSQTFGNLPGITNNIGDTVLQITNLTNLVSITFFNNSNSVTRIDNVLLTYDDGLCLGQECDPIKVPEPGTLALFGMGLLGMALVRRRSIAA